MDLILWRHADAEPLMIGGTFKSDSERQLTPKGLKQAAKMGWWLDKVIPADCRILVSPAQRTLQTAQALERHFHTEKAVGMQSTVDQILKACNWPHSHETVLVVGHQPVLSEIVSAIIPELAHVEIRKANVWWIGQKSKDEASLPFLKAVMAPDLVFN